MECFRKTWFSNTSRSNANLELLDGTIKHGNKKSKSQGIWGNQHPVNLLRLKILLKQVKWSRILVQWALPEQWGCKRYNLTSLPFSRPLVTFQGGSKIVTVVTLIITVIIAITVFIMNSTYPNLKRALHCTKPFSRHARSDCCQWICYERHCSEPIVGHLSEHLRIECPPDKVNTAEFLGWCGYHRSRLDNIKRALAKQNSFAFLTTKEFGSLLPPQTPFFNLDCRAQFFLHQHSFIVNNCHHCTIKPLQ